MSHQSLPNGQFNVLFRNDQLGFQVPTQDTSFYSSKVCCKIKILICQNVLTIVQVNINIEGINNTDRLVVSTRQPGQYCSDWEQYVESVYAAAVEQLTGHIRNMYSVTSRTNDQITLNFGDGVFATIPVGTFRTYVRASNGLTYIINPEEMQSVVHCLSAT
jgi:hypothetical protein